MKTDFIWPMIRSALLLLLIALAIPRLGAAADGPLAIAVTDEGFSPAELSAPAGAAIQLAVTNQTKVAIEFESYELNRERVVQPGQTVTIYISALAPGRYAFFDDFHPDHRGTLVVK
jgi:plastocyanin